MAGDFIPSFKSIKDSIIPYDFWGQPVYLDGNGKPQCPGFAGNTFSTNPWDFVSIGTLKTPGVCEVSAHKFRDLDKKKQKGNDGARLTVHGVEPALIEIKITIWTPDQLNELRNVWLTIFPPPQKVNTTKLVLTPGAPHLVSQQVGQRADGTPIVAMVPGATTFTSKKVSNTSVSTPVKYFQVLHPVFTTHRIVSVLFLSGEGPSTGSAARSRVFVIKGIENLKVGKLDVTKTPTETVPPQITKFSQNYNPPGENQSNAGPVAKD